MATKILVKGFDPQTSVEALTTLFANYGDVLSVLMNKNVEMPSAYIEMQRSDEALKAMTTLNNKLYAGKKLSVNQARPTQDNGPDGAKYRIR